VKFLFSLLIALFIWSSCIFANLEQSLQTVLQGKLYKDVDMSILFYSLKNDQTLYAFNSRGLFTPASVIKVPLSLLVLEQLGKNFTFKTKIYSDWENKDSTSLYIKASGDPSIRVEQLKDLALLLKEKGFQNIDTIVLDENGIHSDVELNPGQGVYYCGLSSAFNVNYNLVQFFLKDNQLDYSPKVPYLQVNTSKLKIHEKSKSPGYPNLFLQPSSNIEHLYVRGEVSKDRVKSRRLKARVQSGNQFFKALLLQEFANQGISVQNCHFGFFDDRNKRLVTVIESQPLEELLKELNKKSNNMLANALLKQLSFPSKEFTQDNGLAHFHSDVFRRFASTETEWKLYDGSGLNKNSVVTAEGLNWFFNRIYSGPYYTSIKNSMNVFQASAIPEHLRSTVNVYYKTGTLAGSGVSNAGGYIENTSTNEVISFVILGKSQRKNQGIYQAMFATPLVKGFLNNYAFN
jgi:D-alanyl-D-alanine carboxypeptidase/D-alanyl-D-alanine-endopeptidase (penicillin-binding protein 4)